MLPNGWRVTPAGSITPLGTLPLHMATDPGGRWLAVTTGGFGTPEIDILDMQTGAVVARQTLRGAFYGLAFGGQTLYASEAQGGAVVRFHVSPESGALTPLGSLQLAGDNLWVAGLASAPNGTLYVAEMDADSVAAVDGATGAVRWIAKVGRAPYAVVLSADGSRIFVTNWAGGDVSVLDAATGRVVATISTDAHPNAAMLSRDGRTLFVACANADTVTMVDTARLAVTRRIATALYPNSLPGALPNGLAQSPDGRMLFVADAGDNAVVAVDVTAASPDVVGAIPVGWYPTDVAVSPDGSKIFVLDGKGTSGHANPRFPHIDVLRGRAGPLARFYDAAAATGDVEMLPMPERQTLLAGLATARADAAYAGRVPEAAQLPPIRHVIYIIKENRTYDEVLGDDPRGNGDARLTIFGARITPNIHSLADSFVLLDNFDTDATVSADGHNWSTAAYASDWVDKLWPPEYAGRRRTYDFEERGPASPAAGYLWNDALAHGVNLRDYGEFIRLDGHPPFEPSDPTLNGHVDERYRGFDLRHSDQERIDEWLREFAAYVRNGNLPPLEIVRLPDDHTAAVRPGYKTPYAMVADNDYALGRLVDAVSHSPYWSNTVILSVEDDAQAGPDHVSDHRAEALIAGAWVKRGFVDHTHYTTCSVLRTIELLLGLPPMSQFDAAATPLVADFAAKPDARPWSALPPRIDVNAVNPAGTADARLSSALPLADADEADPGVFTALLYRFAATHRPRVVSH